MGLMGDIFKSGLEKAQKMNNDYEQYRDKYDRQDDRELIQSYKHSSGVRKVAIASLLRERGYGKDDD